MYDTLGFPLDLTKLMAANRNLDLDEEGFHEQMEIQKMRSRTANKSTKIVSDADFTLLATETSYLATNLKLQPTIDSTKYDNGGERAFVATKYLTPYHTYIHSLNTQRLTQRLTPFLALASLEQKSTRSANSQQFTMAWEGGSTTTILPQPQPSSTA